MNERNNQEWRDDAACTRTDPEQFFTSHKATIEKVANEICGRCVVREQCLEYALKTHQTFGLWGGLTEQERRALLRRAARTRYR